MRPTTTSTSEVKSEAKSARKAYVAPRVITHSQEDLKRQSAKINACASHVEVDPL
jgi:hypothetical protein